MRHYSQLSYRRKVCRTCTAYMTATDIGTDSESNEDPLVHAGNTLAKTNNVILINGENN
jgi:hypothetical protein